MSSDKYTHIAYNGYLVRLNAVQEYPPSNARLLAGYGRLVTPHSNYAYCPTCTVYHVAGQGYIATHVRETNWQTTAPYLALFN